jgi:polysaccharide biosynthesis transport protein
VKFTDGLGWPGRSVRKVAVCARENNGEQELEELMTDASADRPRTVADYLAVLRRRKWIVLVPILVAGLSAFFVSSRQEPEYRATAEVLVDRTNLDPSSDPERFLNTLAGISRSPELARRVAAELPGMTQEAVLGQTGVAPSADADLLSVNAIASREATAVQLANTFASEFTKFTEERAEQKIKSGLASIRKAKQSLLAQGQAASPQYAELLQQEGELEAQGKLVAGNTTVLRPADGAEQTQPTPRRDATLAALLGLVLGLGLAFLAEALDRHVRSEHEVGEALGRPVLARLQKPPRRLRQADELVMLADPVSIQAEAFRKLRTSLEFVTPEEGPRTLMVTSAGAQEGKSTTIANLAVALARANRRVVLVDLDLRAPFIGRLFRVSGRPGITDVAVGRATLEEALRQVALPAMPAAPTGVRRNGNDGLSSSNGGGQVGGVLHILPAGTIPPSADEMLQDPRVAAVLDELGTQFDRVLVDAPPLLAFGDALLLSANVDAMFAVTRLGKVQRPLLHEFARQLATCRAELLGYVLTGAERSDSSRYIYEGYAYDIAVRDRWSSQDKEQV